MPGCEWGGGCAVFNDKAAAYGEVRCCVQGCAVCVQRGEARAVGVLHVRAGRQHGVFVEEEVCCFVKADQACAAKRQHARRPHGCELWLDGCCLDPARLLTGEAQQHGAVCRMAAAGERKRAVELGNHPLGLLEESAFDERKSKGARRSHGTHGVRAGRSDADLEQIEEAGFHLIDSSPLREAVFGSQSALVPEVT